MKAAKEFEIDYEKKIPMISEIEGVSYSPAYGDPEQATIKDQVLELLTSADDRYAEFLSGHCPDYAFDLIDAVKLLNAAIDRSDEEMKNQVAQ